MILASFLIGILTGMGVGSGGLFILYLTLFAGVPQLAAQGLNLHFFIYSTAAAMLVHARTGTLPLRRLAYICALGSLGCVGGALFAQSIDGGILRTLLALLLIFSGATTLLAPTKRTQRSA